MRNLMINRICGFVRAMLTKKRKEMGKEDNGVSAVLSNEPAVMAVELDHFKKDLAEELIQVVKACELAMVSPMVDKGKAMGDVIGGLSSVLGKLDVEVIDDRECLFDVSRHKVVSVEKGNQQERNGMVVGSLERGFKGRGIDIPQCVKVYLYSNID